MSRTRCLPSGNFLRYLGCVLDLEFSFGRFSYAFSLCLGPGIFLRAIFLGILAVFLTWHFASREFLISRPCILHHVIFSRVMVVPVRSIFERFGAFAPKECTCVWALIYIFERFGALVPKMLRFCILLWAIVFACIQCFRRGISLRAIFFARGTWKLNHVLLVLWLYEMFCV